MAVGEQNGGLLPQELEQRRHDPLVGVFLEEVAGVGEVEEPLFKAVMDYTQGNQSQAAGILGINRGTLRKKLKTYSLLQ